ncbi:MAG TPA: hypothetical protein VMS31_00465 [Pyrinomonadaceae bacterium]|nr:hypothetical protein [Pyrinomonadaceae bacterium]
MSRSTKLSLMILMLLVAGLLLTSCGDGAKAPATNASSTASTSPAPSPKVGFEKDLEYVRKGQYTYVWVFSRKDGKPLDKDDAAFLRKNAPQVVDWVTSDEGRKVIAGTNFDLSLGNLESIKKRLVAEDYSNR